MLVAAADSARWRSASGPGTRGRALAIHLSAVAFRPRRPDRRLDDPHTGRGEHGVEGGGESGIPVPDQELEAIRLAFEVYQQVPGLLGTHSPVG